MKIRPSLRFHDYLCLFMKLRFSALFLVLTLFAASAVEAAPLVTGKYHIKVPLGPALLNGRYPVTVNEGIEGRTANEGRLDVTTSATGAISGKIEIFAETAEVTGSIKTRKSGTKLTLRGKTTTGKRVTVKATLTGTIFNGTAKLGKAKGPARIDLEGVAPAQLEYALMITVADNGKISGTGTLRSDVATQQVTVSGKTKDASASLRISGDKTKFEGDGATNDTGFTAKWKAQALGALLKGDSLPVIRE
jgi:hypothetical protein